MPGLHCRPFERRAFARPARLRARRGARGRGRSGGRARSRVRTDLRRAWLRRKRRACRRRSSRPLGARRMRRQRRARRCGRRCPIRPARSGGDRSSGSSGVRPRRRATETAAANTIRRRARRGRRTRRDGDEESDGDRDLDTREQHGDWDVPAARDAELPCSPGAPASVPQSFAPPATANIAAMQADAIDHDVACHGDDGARATA